MQYLKTKSNCNTDFQNRLDFSRWNGTNSILTSQKKNNNKWTTQLWRRWVGQCSVSMFVEGKVVLLLVSMSHSHTTLHVVWGRGEGADKEISDYTLITAGKVHSSIA